MNRLAFIILSVLLSNDAIDQLKAMTAKEMIETEDFSYKENTLYKKLKEFVTLGYISEGLKDGKASTFYITQSGIDFLKDQRGDFNEE